VSTFGIPMTALAAVLARILAPLSRACLWIAALGLVLMSASVAWQVFGRKVLNDSPSWTEPGALLLMSWFIILGSAVCVREGEHMGFDIGLHYAPPPLRFLMKAVSHILIIIFGGYMAIYGWQLMAKTWSAKMAGIALPQGMDYLPLVGGGVLISLFAFENLVNQIARRQDTVVTGPGGHAPTGVE
jgi:TRAP-type C4-dicarboxylate transport system permease small subunit